jgi:hypothetical protein
MISITRKMMFLAVSMLSLVLVLSGCGDGKNGRDGQNGLNGADGPGGAPGAAGADGSSLFKAANRNISFSTLAVSSAAGLPTVDFTLLSGTVPVTGLQTANLRFYLTELIPGAAATDSDQWNQWLQERDRAGTAFGTFTDRGAGKYTYTFKTPFTSAPSQTHLQRLIVRVSGLTGYNSANGDYDFMINAPGTKLASAKDIATSEACNACHGANINNYGHGGGYTGTKTCAICHSSALTTTDMVAAGFDFATMIHQIHSGINAKNVFTSHTAAAKDWSKVVYPGNVLSCSTCHKGTEGANWNSKPTRLTCKSCHTAITFDSTAYTGIKGGAGKLHGFTTDNNCAFCHDVAAITAAHPVPTTSDAAKRTLKATLTAVTINAADGSVTANFTLKNSGVPVTDRAAFGTPSFGLVKLIPETNGANSHWVSYTARFRTKVATQVPVLQSNTENAGVVTRLDDSGNWSYRFALLNSDTPGNINFVTHAHNASATNLVPATYIPANWPTGVNIVTYEPSLTHRAAMSVSLAAPGDTANTTNAYLDFVPNGTPVINTRNIVTMADCAKCHAGKRLHAGYEIEYCVVCHNQSTRDPFTGETVDLQHIIHKLHMGAKLPSVIAGGAYKINGGDFSGGVFPQPISNCLACHNESHSEGANWRTTPTSRSCITCHDSGGSLAHGAQNATEAGESCTVCHAPGRQVPVTDAHGGF